MDHVLVAHKAVAGVVVDRHCVGLLARQKCHHRSRAGLAVLVGHMARFGHGRRNLNRVANHMDVFGRFGFVRQEVDLAPALVSGGESGADRNVAGSHGRHHIEHIGLEVVVELEFQRAGGHIHIGQRVFWPVFDDVLVPLGPGFFEQRAFGGDVVIRV